MATSLGQLTAQIHQMNPWWRNPDTAAKAPQPVPPWVVEALFGVVHKDAFASTQLDETETSALTERIWRSLATPLNESSVAADLGISRDVVSRHLNYLRDNYLMWPAQQLRRGWVGNTRAKDKIYPVDPLIGRLAHLVNAGRPDLDTTLLAESQVGMALQRAQ